MTEDTGGPAFPCDLTAYDEEVRIQYQGMTLRDYFAAKAMEALVAGNSTDAQQISRAAYIVADAMLKAREA